MTSGRETTGGRSLGRRLAGGSTLWGSFAVLGSPNSAEVLARSGLDFVLVDTQHGITGAPLADMIRAIDATAAAVVRVASADPAAIGQALDHNAAAVVVPMIEDSATATAVARACRYPPAGGERSFGPMRVMLAGGEGSAEPLCFVMIETARGYEVREQIASVAGVDGIFVGPSDLAISLGRDMDRTDDDAVLDCVIGEIADTCARWALVAGIQTSSTREARHRRDQGFRLISMRSDFALIRSGADRLCAEVQTQN